MDPRVGVVSDPVFFLHARPGHPERPERLQAITRALAQGGLMRDLVPVPARAATREELLRVHTARHVDEVAVIGRHPEGDLDPDTYTNAHTWDAAVAAAGGTIDLALAVMRGDVDRGVALVRPPGHHATPERAMGFCIFDNVALAARAVQAAEPGARVAIVDFDVHHGNGTQEAFYVDPSVLYVSMHQHPLYPGTGRASETGAGEGRGATVNIPLPPGTGDRGLLAAYARVVAPVVRRFAPDLLLVSAGWDGHWRDPLAHHQISLAAYGELGQTLVALAGEVCAGRIVAVLEGGYDAEVLAAGVANLTRALLDRDVDDDPFGPSPRGETPVAAHLDAILVARDGVEVPTARISRDTSGA